MMHTKGIKRLMIKNFYNFIENILRKEQNDKRQKIRKMEFDE
jgi:hypothetical protein